MKRFIQIIIIIFAHFSLNAAIFQVGASHQYTKPSQIINLVNDGDTVFIDAGVYSDETGTWKKNNLLIKGVDGFAHLSAPATISNGKAIWVIQGNNNFLENIEFSDAHVPDKNGAGIRMEGTNLTVYHCFFHDNEDGILAGADTISNIIIERSEFKNNGFGDGYSHNLYIGNVKSLTFKFNYSHHAKDGHCLKSRANNNYICYNFFTDSLDGHSSYLINFPNGGNTYIIGNILFQGPNADNLVMADYGSEKLINPVNKLYILNNTFVNQRHTCTFISIKDGSSLPTIENKIVNNIFTGIGANLAGLIIGNADTSYNYLEIDPTKLGFTEPNNFDYHLASTSLLIDKGIVPTFLADYPLLPLAEYKHPNDSAKFHLDKKMDIGAYQYNKPSDYKEINGLSNDIEIITGKDFLELIPLNLSTDSQNSFQLTICNILGEIVKSADCDLFQKINISDLSNGLYIVAMKYNNQVKYFKIIK